MCQNIVSDPVTENMYFTENHVHFVYILCLKKCNVHDVQKHVWTKVSSEET